MASPKQRVIPNVPSAAQFESSGAGNLAEITPHLQPLNENLRKLEERIAFLEGRLGPMEILDALVTDGAITGEQSLTITTFLALLGLATPNAPVVSAPDSARAYFNKTQELALLSQNGGAYSPLLALVNLIAGTNISISTSGANATFNSTVTQGCRVFNSGATTLTTGVIKTLSFDTERFDTDTMHDPGTPSRITFTTAGKYEVGGCAAFAINAAGRRLVKIRLNGATDIVVNYFVPGSDDTPVLSCSTIYSFAAADYVEFLGFQNTGGDLDIVVAGNYSPEFWAHRLS